MKKLFLICLLAGMFLSTATAQTNELERRGYDGDFFSLEGALELFKQSRSIRDFERKLNTRDNWVNNLDLDLDGRTDYVRVEHRRQGRLHAIIMQINVNRFDVQDVAVIEIEKTGSREAILQIIGDEDLYGEEIIVEPIEGVASSSGGGQYDDQFYDRGSYGNDFVNVYYWRAVNRLFAPDYQVYASPYYYSYYPTWWSPWNTCTWSIFRPRIRHYRRYHHVVYIHRVHHVHTFYRPYRSYCNAIVFRSNEQRRRQGRKPIYRTATNPNPNRKPVASGQYNTSKQPRGAVNTQGGTKPYNGRIATAPGSVSKAPGTTKPGSRPSVSKAPTSAESTYSRPKPSSTSPSRPTSVDGNYRTSTRSTNTDRGSSSDRGISRTSRSPSTQSSATKPSRSSSSTRSSSSSRDTYSAPSRSSSSSSRSSASKPSRSSSSSTRSSSSSSSRSSIPSTSRSSSSSSRFSASKPSRSSSSSTRSSSSSRSSKPSTSRSSSSRSSSSKSSSSRSSSSKGKRGGK